MSCSKLILLVCVVCCVAPSACTSGPCEFQYIEQPPDELTCNPYANEELRLECTVEVPQNSNGSIVNWFYSNSSVPLPSGCGRRQLNTDMEERIFVLRPPNSVRNGKTFVRTQLRVLQLSDIHVGTYWCMVQSTGVMGFLPSDPLYLQPNATYTNVLPCPTVRAVSKEETKCALPVQPTLSLDSNTMKQTSTATPESQSQVNPSQSVTVASITAMLQTSSSPSVLPTSSAEAEPSSLPLPNSPLQPSAIPDSSVLPPFSDPNASIDENLLTKLYIAIGVLGVVIVLILALLAVSIGLYLRKYHWKRNGRCASTQSSVCESSPADLVPSVSFKSYFCSQRSSSATGSEHDSGCGSQPSSRRSTLPVPHLPSDFVRSALPRGLETSNEHSYETSFTISRDHDYEDIPDLEDSDNEYVQISPVNMKRNPSYSAIRVQNRVGAGGGEPVVPLPNPLVVSNPAVCTDELQQAHDYLIPVPSSETGAGTS